MNHKDISEAAQVMTRFLRIVIGNILICVPYVFIMVPRGIINGGVTSMSLILHRASIGHALSVSMWVTILTAVIAAMCLVFLGRDFFLGSLFGCTCYVIFFDIFSYCLPEGVVTYILDMRLAGSVFMAELIQIIAAAATVGVGYALCIRARATTVGMDTIAIIIHEKFRSVPIAPAMYGINIVILLMGLAAYGYSSVLWGILFAGVQALVLHLLCAGIK